MASVAEIKAALFSRTGTSVEQRGSKLYTWIDDPSEEGGEEELDAFTNLLDELKVPYVSVDYTGRSNRNDRGEVSSEIEIALKRYGIDCRHASGSSHWGAEPDAYDFASREEAEAAIESLEPEDDDGAALEYRVVEVGP